MRIFLQVFLIITILTLGLYFLQNQGSKAQAWKKIAAVLFVILAIFAILFPQIADILASWVGVEQGTDLILYVLILLIIYIALSQTLTRHRDQQEKAKIVQRLAILEKEAEDRRKSSRKKSPSSSKKIRKKSTTR